MSAEPRPDSASRKTRTKSFSGCWTCRAKHVKCDETRPSCNRCRRSGISCEGYGIRLSWTSVRNPATFRSRTPSTRRAAQRATSRLLHARREGSVEEPVGGNEDPAEEQTGSVADAGEASVQSRQSETVSPAGQASWSLPEEEPFSGGLSTRLFNSYSLLGQGLATRVSGIPLQQPGSLNQTSSTLGIQHYPSASTPINIGEVGVNSSTVTASNTPSSDHARRHQTLAQDEPSAQGKRHLDLLENPALQRELIEHWSMHLCDALNPVPGVHNPMRTVMMPIALEGCRTDSKKSTGATALFHLICSASAFHLSQTRKPEAKRSLENVALEHHNLGIAHLAQNIQSDDRSQCVSLLASLIMCIMNEAITLPTQFWRLHLRGAMEWVNHIEPQIWHQTEAASTCYQMFMGMATLVQAQLLIDGQEVALQDFTYDPKSQPKPYALNLAFGLPQPLMQGIHAMNTFCLRHKIRSGGIMDQDDNESREALDRLELELYLSVPKKPTEAMSREYGDLIYHHGCTFYFAALMHMKRTLKDTPIAEVQTLVEQALDHMEALQTCTTRPFSSMIWPIAIVAFEALDGELQNRILKCLDFFVERSELAIWEQITHLIKDLWALRKTVEGANVKWHETVLGCMSDSFMLL
ncbi:hypothetical protein ACJ41O_012858 [Fusarium nematophilum]